MLAIIQSRIFCLPVLYQKNLKIKIYKTVILPVVLYGCETWSLTLKEEPRLKVFENKVLRRIFGPKREGDRSWRELHNDELHSLYSSPNIVRVIKSRRIGWAGHMARMGEGRGVYRRLVGRPEGTKPQGRPRRRWDNIKMDLREIGPRVVTGEKNSPTVAHACRKRRLNWVLPKVRGWSTGLATLSL
jgi:hypothetical protein